MLRNRLMTIGDLMIKIENLTKRFGERIAVAGIDLEIKRGEIFGL